MASSVCVIGGLGRIGLVMSAVLGRYHKVFIHDINAEAKAKFFENRGSIFYEPGLDEELKTSNVVLAVDLENALKHSEYIIITIGTPVDEFTNPCFDFIFSLFDDLLPYLTRDHKIIICSTVYPGTTKKIEKYLLRKKDYKINVAFCPERMAGSKMVEEFKATPQLVSSNNKKLLNDVVKFFKDAAIETVTLNDTTSGELVKLFTNSFRYINFAIANQFFILAEDLGCNFYDIYDAMKFKYARMDNFPKAGLTGGYCLRKDTMQLFAQSNKINLGYNAMFINESMPLYIFRKVRTLFDDISDIRVGILGMAFKGESDDIRESLSYRLYKIFVNESKEVFCSDEYVKDSRFLSAEDLIKNSDVVIIAACHKKYFLFNWSEISKQKIVIDIWSSFLNEIGW